MVHNGKHNVTGLRGQWETFLIATVPNPLPHVSLGLVIVGSDRRGTATVYLNCRRHVLNATTTGTSTHQVTRIGSHVLRIYMIDAGVVLDKIVIDAGGIRPSYLGPPETKILAEERKQTND